MGIFLLVSLRDPNSYYKLIDVSRVIPQLRGSGGGASDGSCAAVVARSLRKLQAVPARVQTVAGYIAVETVAAGRIVVEFVVGHIVASSLCDSHSWLQMKLMMLPWYYFPHPFYVLLQHC